MSVIKNILILVGSAIVAALICFLMVLISHPSPIKHYPKEVIAEELQALGDNRSERGLLMGVCKRLDKVIELLEKEKRDGQRG